MKIPVFVLSGFLGSGKTTLLLHLLRESGARGLKPGVIVNELGQNDVDGELAQEQSGAAVQKLLDGCVCCSGKDELPGCIETLLKSQPDVIFIELTGIADPGEIKAEIDSPRWKARLVRRRSVTILDAEHVLDYNSRFSSDRQLVRTLRRQMEIADLLIINKCDLAEQETLWRIERMLDKHNPEAERVFTHYGRLQTGKLLEGILPRRLAPPPQRGAGAANGARLVKAAVEPVSRSNAADRSVRASAHGSVTAVTLTFPAGMSVLRADLESFLSSREDRLLRAKGHVPLENSGLELLQAAGGRFNWEPSRYPGTPYIVLIGMGWEETRLHAEWDDLCRRTTRQAAPP